ncbi:Tetratricopeptide repeat-containing protein [Asanoa hainanensis]|uniref:Tetratricopeptide repeat-containing protein n=1 Tax=Asanoa hainanensis TaxID=560556 RepID=A0A239P7W4_9ACTN|nr:Tetratricopeptide repeat-containing protein [Asanoa hainanensis]
MTGTLAIAKVLAHCGGSPKAAVTYLVRAVAADPCTAEPWSALEDLRRALPDEVSAVVAAATTVGPVVARAYLSFVDGDMDEAAISLGSVTGFQPEIPWADAPWFGDERFLGTVSAAAFAEGTMRIRDHDRDLRTDAVRANLTPWLTAIDVVCGRDPDPDAMARMAILLRACDRTDASFALCDRADAVRRLAFTEVVRAGTWRHLGNRPETAAAFRRALALDPTNWSLHLDLADLAAEEGDFAEAAALATRGEELEPDDVTMRAAAAAYRARSTGSAADLEAFTELAPQVPDDYRQTLLGYANRT